MIRAKNQLLMEQTLSLQNQFDEQREKNRANERILKNAKGNTIRTALEVSLKALLKDADGVEPEMINKKVRKRFYNDEKLLTSVANTIKVNKGHLARVFKSMCSVACKEIVPDTNLLM